MNCISCQKQAVVSGYCKEHFIEYFEDTVKDTIKKYKLLKNDKVVVAVSGGKDSLTTLYILKKLGYNVEGIAIDEGIKGYREHTLKDLKKFCEKNKIEFNVISFKKEFGVSLDSAVKKTKESPCHVCGVFRRFLLNKYAKNFDVIATGHNLDDECQAVMMNILKSQPELSARLGPVTGIKASNKFTKRIKPLYFLKDKEVKAYTVIKGFWINFTECPYSHASFRSKVQDELNLYESKHPGAKLNLIKSFLNELPSLKKKFLTSNNVGECQNCGQAASRDGYCNSCRLIEKLKAA